MAPGQRHILLLLLEIYHAITLAGAKFEPENTRLMDKQRVKSAL